MLFISSPSYAAKLKLGETYFGTLNKLYLGNNTIALPPGQWEVVELETEKGYTDFKKAKFKNKKNNAQIYIRVSMTESWQIRWTKGFMPFDACDYGTILAKGKGRKHTKSGGHTYWCVIKDGQWISIYNVKMAQKLMTVVYEFKTSNIKIDKSNAEYYGNQIYQEFLKGFKGNKSANLNFLTSIIDDNPNSSFSSNYMSEYAPEDVAKFKDKRICLLATSENGSSWVKFPAKYYDEAIKRGLSIETCNNLTNRTKVTSKDSSSVKSKLKELKGLLDEGLISQEQYNEKSSKILEEL